ncbi:MAG: DUF1232 domain-containing protein [Lachnospiraceae bacterium]
MTWKEKAGKLKTDIPAVFLALRHKQTPWYAKAVAGLTVGYALSPIDLIPDFIPVLGYLDDLILLPLLIALVVHLIPKEVFAECKEQAQDLWKNGKPKKWYYAIPILLIWLFLLVLFIKLLF